MRPALRSPITRCRESFTSSREAQEQKGRAQQWIDRFGRRYSPAVLAAAGLFAARPFLRAPVRTLGPARRGPTGSGGTVRAQSCPCPWPWRQVSVAPDGMEFYQGRRASGASWPIRTVAFDKTGTLTSASPLSPRSSPSSAGRDRTAAHDRERRALLTASAGPRHRSGGGRPRFARRARRRLSIDYRRRRASESGARLGWLAAPLSFAAETSTFNG